MTKLVELENFKKKINLVGTRGVIKVTKWTSESQAVDKLLTI